MTWGQENYQKFSWREASQPWHGLIAEILLQRTRARNVEPVYERFICRFNSLDELAAASVEDIEEVIHSLGLAWRAARLRDLGKGLLRSGGRIPNTVEDLKKLPGVGEYVASAWLSFHGGVRCKIVDANIVRFICRLLGKPMDGETRRQEWLHTIAEDLTPRRNWKTYNYAVLDFTMKICGTRPLCKACPIEIRLCSFGRGKLS